MEGVLVTGTARAQAEGECVRCLEPLSSELEADFQEMFSYPDADDRGRAEAEPADDAEDDEDRLFLEDGLFDLEPVLRDAVVLALPMQPVCQETAPACAPNAESRLADDPDHHHDAVDIRWAALQGLAETIRRRREGQHERRRSAASTRSRRSSRGCSEAEDVAQQHAPPPVAVEGCGPHPGCVRALPGAEAAAHRVPELRHLQQAPGPRGLSGW